MIDNKRVELVRGIGRWDLAALVVNGVVGAGIFGLPSRVFALTGPYSLIAFGVCGVLIFFVVVCFAEVASRFDRTGGPYLFARAAFGPLVGFEVGWLLCITRIAGLATICVLLVQYLTFFSPIFATNGGRSLTISGLIVGVTLIQLVGIRETAWTGNVFTIAKLFPILLFVGAGLFRVDWGRLDFSAPVEPRRFGMGLLILGFAFVGFETPVIAAGESRSPRRDFPFALIIGMSLVVLLYLLIQVVCVGTLPELASSEKPLADAARGFLGENGARLIAFGAVVSMLGTLNAAMLAATRLPFAMAENGQFPNFLGRVHPRFRTPHVSILLTGAVVLPLALTGAFSYVLTVAVLTRLAVYATTCAALPRLRRMAGQPSARFMVRGGTAVSIVALVCLAGMISGSSFREARDCVIAALVGLGLYYWVGKPRENSMAQDG
jgi:amino acid transporter